MMKHTPSPRCAFCDSENTGLASVQVTCNDCSHSYEYDVPAVCKAAPHLLKALKFCERTLNRLLASEQEHNDGSEEYSAILKARAAIAKAEGED